MSVYNDIMTGLNEAVEAKKRMDAFTKLLFSGIVKHDTEDMSGEVFARAGDIAYGYLNYYGDIPYILGKIEDVCSEYVAPEYWLAVKPESIRLLVGGTAVTPEELAELEKLV